MDYQFNRIFYRVIKHLLLYCFIACTLSSCSNNNNTYAPVIEGWQQTTALSSHYIVQKGDTLYSIAWAFDMDYRELAHTNNLPPSYKIEVGQSLKMTTPKHYHKQVYNAHNTNKSVIKYWLWPTHGKVIKKFSLQHGNKGIDINAQLGSPIKASADGVVVYSGSGLRGYGKLIIIKHNADFLSAYAHNNNVMIKEQQLVKAGQEIATMGRANNGQIMLHFEIRQNGKPVNPMKYLDLQKTKMRKI